MSETFKAALVQTCTGINPSDSAIENARLLEAAAAGGAAFVFYPEVCNLIDADRVRARPKIQMPENDETLARLRDGAARHGVWVLAGSIVTLPEEGAEKLANRSFLINASGDIVQWYDKMHLFDVNVGSDDQYRESDTYQGGDRVALAETPWGTLGMTVCYDLRFPHLYRDLAKAGAQMLTIPSAFTRPTGAAHWETLLRARAIECGAFVLAPAQTGEHEGGRKTYGHSLAVGPWGDVLADGGLETGITYVDIDVTECTKARSRIPALTHDRMYDL